VTKVAGQGGTVFLLSVGADKRLCLWDITRGVLVGCYQEGGIEEIGADDQITDLAYSRTRQEFAYSSLDKQIYIRKFSINPDQWKLLHVLQGHDGEVTHLCWNPTYTQWVSGSDDCSIKTWSVSDNYLNMTTTTTSTQCPVTALSIDKTNGVVIVGVQDVIRVYEPNNGMELVQTHTGHTDSVRSIIHMPERSQYLSVSWDSTICVWNAYKPKRCHSS